MVISPTLASTIGLEEAVMLQVLAELIDHKPVRKLSARSDLKFVSLSDKDLQQAFPFWAAIDIKRIQANLQSLGLIAIEADTSAERSVYVAIDESRPTGNAGEPDAPPMPQIPPRPSAPSGAATLMEPGWQPDQNWIQQCRQQNIPEAFIHGLVEEFVAYWRDRGQARFSWGNAFYKHVIKEWRMEQSRQGAWEKSSTMSAQWVPSEDAIGILLNAGINPSFIEDAIPEFVLYWRERGIVAGAWNTKFIEHIRRQWGKFSAAFGFDDTPKIIPDDWQPSAECYEILQLAEIDEDYARSKIPEFLLYWKDSQQVKSSWNTVFLQFIKQDWARKLKQLESADIDHGENQTLVGSGQQRIEEKFKRIADRSWAE